MAALVTPAEPYQRWVDEAKVPTPRGAVVASEEPCPSYPASSSSQICTDGETIWGAGWDGRVTFFHELGHIYDQRELSGGDRERFLALVDRRDLLWDEADGEELLADAYSQCALRRRWRASAQRLLIRGWQPVSGREMRQVCTLIVRSYWR